MTRLLVVCEVPVLAIALAMLFGLRINVSPSIPYGLYWESRVPATIRYGEILIFRVEGRSIPLAKPIAGIEGDDVCQVGGALWIRGVNYGPVLETWNGVPLPSAVAENCCVVVPPDYVFLATTTPRSYDSRYFGPVAVARLQGVLRPLLTWREIP